MSPLSPIDHAQFGQEESSCALGIAHLQEATDYEFVTVSVEKEKNCVFVIAYSSEEMGCVTVIARTTSDG